MLDLLSGFITDLRLEVQAPRTHLLTGQWALLVPRGLPSLHLLRRGSCIARSTESRHPLPFGSGRALLLSGTRECSLEAPGPERTVVPPFDWNGGTPLEEVVFPPEEQGAALLLSAQIKRRGRAGDRVPLPAVSVLDPDQVWTREWREPLLDALNTELSHPRLGVSAIVTRLLEVLVIRGLRTELRAGAWKASGWLGALTDPVLRTGLIDAETESALASVRALAAEVHRSPARIRARVSAFSGAPPGRLLRQLRMDRAMRRLEESEPTLEDLASESRYATVSTFCRAFRREVGCTPAAYWRRTRNRPFPRRPRHPPPRSASDENPAALDSAARDDESQRMPEGPTVHDPRAAARRILTGYRDGIVTLESLVSWAEAVEASDPADPWLRRTAQSLADPLLCRERAMAFVRDLLGD
jgi:AraC-like DNA-binding protein